jgi:tRNA threonylcarbamoyladenosine biosynthesis protein TsaB
MRILAYDTSSPVLSIALFEGNKIIGGFESALFSRHSSTLAPSIDMTLRSCRRKIGDIDVLAVGLGPGSFTGLRVGLVTAKTLAYSLNKKIVSFSSLEIIARGVSAKEGENIAVLLDAKRQKVYAALFKRVGTDVKVIEKPALVEAEAWLGGIKKPFILSRDAAPKASDMLRPAMDLIARKQFTDPFKLEPLYLYPKDCNVTPVGKHHAKKRR